MPSIGGLWRFACSVWWWRWHLGVLHAEICSSGECKSGVILVVISISILYVIYRMFLAAAGASAHNSATTAVVCCAVAVCVLILSPVPLTTVVVLISTPAVVVVNFGDVQRWTSHIIVVR